MATGDLAPTLEDAVALAAQSHHGQVYPTVQGEPFILHPLRVLLQVEAGEAQVVAVLHDVIEDTACTLGDLRELGYSERVLDALDRLTHREGEAYDAYIARIVDDPLARQVKLADLADNLANNRRIAESRSSIEVHERIRRYERAIEQLSAAATVAVNTAAPMP